MLPYGRWTPSWRPGPPRGCWAVCPLCPYPRAMASSLAHPVWQVDSESAAWPTPWLLARLSSLSIPRGHGIVTSPNLAHNFCRCAWDQVTNVTRTFCYLVSYLSTISLTKISLILNMLCSKVITPLVRRLVRVQFVVPSGRKRNIKM